MLIVLVTAPNEAEAEDLAVRIVEERLAACVQILPRMTSVYVWEGTTQREHEWLLMIKTLDDRFEALSAFIRDKHSYDIPEIAAIDAERVSEPYLVWMKDVLDIS